MYLDFNVPITLVYIEAVALLIWVGYCIKYKKFSIYKNEPYKLDEKINISDKEYKKDIATLTDINNMMLNISMYEVYNKEEIANKIFLKYANMNEVRRKANKIKTDNVAKIFIEIEAKYDKRIELFKDDKIGLFLIHRNGVNDLFQIKTVEEVDYYTRGIQHEIKYIHNNLYIGINECADINNNLEMILLGLNKRREEILNGNK